MANKVYKGRQKLNFEQAGDYYKHAYKIGVEHGKFEERQRIMKELDASGSFLFGAQRLKKLIKGEQK